MIEAPKSICNHKITKMETGWMWHVYWKPLTVFAGLERWFTSCSQFSSLRDCWAHVAVFTLTKQTLIQPHLNRQNMIKNHLVVKIFRTGFILVGWFCHHVLHWAFQIHKSRCGCKAHACYYYYYIPTVNTDIIPYTFFWFANFKAAQVQKK